MGWENPGDQFFKNWSLSTPAKLSQLGKWTEMKHKNGWPCLVGANSWKANLLSKGLGKNGERLSSDREALVEISVGLIPVQTVKTG